MKKKVKKNIQKWVVLFVIVVYGLFFSPVKVLAKSETLSGTQDEYMIEVSDLNDIEEVPESCLNFVNNGFSCGEEMKAAVSESLIGKQIQFQEIKQKQISDMLLNSVEMKATWNGGISNGFAGGDGSENNPYQIATAEQLAKLANDVSNLGIKYTGQYFVLTQDIVLNENVLNKVSESDVSSLRSWTPIGNASYAFEGVFDGYGYTISGLYINSESMDYAGLFGTVNGGIVGNIILEDSYVVGGDKVGGICGYMRFGAVVSSLNAGVVSGYDYVGGVCGYVYDGFIYGGYNVGVVLGRRQVIGGICGYFAWDEQLDFAPKVYVIEGCINVGDVIANGGWVGGICGESIDHSYTYSAEIRYCANTGNVTAGDYIGGISGLGYADVICCYNTGNVDGSLYVGGIYGAGVGNKITSSYNVGTIISSRTSVGLLDSIGYGANCDNCYYLEGTSAKEDGTPGEKSKMTAAQFASGEVAYLLNGSVNCGTTWYQTIGEDPYPVLDEWQQTVYFDGDQYKNGHSAEWRPNEDGISHDGICVYCGVLFTNEKHTIGEDYTCTECGFVVPVEKIRAFVERLYETALGRTGDVGGITFWVNELAYGRRTAAQVAANFFFCDEFVAQKNDNSTFMDRLYSAFFNRTADEGGKNFWLSYLEKGVTRRWVAARFITADEFTEVCAAYGIEKGKIELTKYADKNINVTMYVYRCYKEILSREADAGGLEYWCKTVITGEREAAAVAKNMVNSPEFQSKNLSDTEYMKVLYRAFMGREADIGGLNYWVSRLENGESRNSVLNAFVNCKEFDEILKSFAL